MIARVSLLTTRARARVTRMADLEPSNLSAVVTCLTIECENYERKWTIYPVRNQPGLIVWPTLLCESCITLVAVIKDLSND